MLWSCKIIANIQFTTREGYIKPHKHIKGERPLWPNTPIVFLKELCGANHPSIIAIKKALPMGNSFSFTNVKVNETYNLLMKMNCKMSTGFVDIIRKLLKIGSAPLAPPICNLVNLMFMESCLPDIPKYAEVAVLFKRLDNLNKENFRPVSVLKALSNVLEKVSRVQMSSYFESIFSTFS